MLTGLSCKYGSFVVEIEEEVRKLVQSGCLSYRFFIMEPDEQVTSGESLDNFLLILYINNFLYNIFFSIFFGYARQLLRSSADPAGSRGSVTKQDCYRHRELNTLSMINEVASHLSLTMIS